MAHKDSPDESSVLFGTIHLGSTDISSKLGRVLPWIQQYDRVYTETDMSSFDSDFLLRNCTVTSEDMSANITAKQWQKYRKIIFKCTQVDIDHYRNLRPMMLMGVLTQKMISPSGQEISLDQQIWQRAQKMSKTVDGIEYIEEQERLMRSIPLRYDYIQFKRFARHISRSRRFFNRMIKLYLQEDILTLARMTRRSLGELRKAMMVDRNRIMAERIAAAHSKDPSLFTFGAGHLAGSDGVLRLLKNNGFKISPVT